MGNQALDQIGTWKYPDNKFVYEKQVLIRQTNVFGNTYFSNYIEWQGEVREKFLLQHPASKAFLQKNSNLTLVTYSLFHRFINNTFFGDSLKIELTSRDVQKNSLVLVFNYLTAQGGERIGEGWQKICFRDMSKNMLCDVPQIVLDLVEPIRESGIKMSGKLEEKIQN